MHIHLSVELQIHMSYHPMGYKDLLKLSHFMMLYHSTMARYIKNANKRKMLTQGVDINIQPENNTDK